MNDFDPAMRVVKRIAQSFDIWAQVCGVKDLIRLCDTYLGQGGSVHVFHRYGSRIIVLLEIVNPDNVGVGQVKT